MATATELRELISAYEVIVRQLDRINAELETTQTIAVNVTGTHGFWCAKNLLTAVYDLRSAAVTALRMAQAEKPSTA